MARTCLAFLACAIAFSSHAARAQSFDGDWIAGPARVDVEVAAWSPACGPRPESIAGFGQGAVRIATQREHLVFRGARSARTDGCWSENRAVRRVSTSASAGAWRTICRTPSDDPKAETGTYTLRATSPDHLSFRDVSRYDWRVGDATCTATLTTTQIFDRVGQAATAQTPPREAPATDPARRVVRRESARPGVDDLIAHPEAEGDAVSSGDAVISGETAGGPQARADGSITRALGWTLGAAAIFAVFGIGGLLLAGARRRRRERARAVEVARVDLASLEAVSRPPSSEAWVCPTCRRAFPAETRTCPQHGDALIPYAAFTAEHKRREEGDGARVHVCPTCGERYPRTVSFCANDGAKLTFVN